MGKLKNAIIELQIQNDPFDNLNLTTENRQGTPNNLVWFGFIC